MNLLQLLTSKLEKTYLRDGQYLYKIESVNAESGRLEGISVDTYLDPDVGPINLMWDGYVKGDFSDLSEVEIISQEEFEIEVDKALNDLKKIITK